MAKIDLGPGPTFHPKMRTNRKWYMEWMIFVAQPRPAPAFQEVFDAFGTCENVGEVEFCIEVIQQLAEGLKVPEELTDEKVLQVRNHHTHFHLKEAFANV